MQTHKKRSSTENLYPVASLVLLDICCLTLPIAYSPVLLCASVKKKKKKKKHCVERPLLSHYIGNLRFVASSGVIVKLPSKF